MINPFKKKEAKEKTELDADLPVKKVRRRKKNEPEKPWGKIERIIVLFFFLLAPLLSIFFLFHSHNPSKPKVLGNIISNTPKDIDSLKTSLSQEIANQKGTYGIWLQAVDGSYSLGIHEKEKFDGASLFKLPLMIAYYQAVDAGTIDPATNYTIRYSDALSGAGVLATMSPGTVVTYQDMVDYMGKNSDNSAFAIMQNALGVNSETDVINQLGMKDTDFNLSTTTPYDIGQLFYKLINTNLISTGSQNKLFVSLKNTDFETLIPKGVPSTVQVAHKYAANDNGLHDAGIVYTTRPFILVILSKNIDAEAQDEFPILTKIVYDWADK